MPEPCRASADSKRMSRAFELCYITDRHALEPAPLLPRIVEAIRAGVDLLEVREKDLSARELVELVRAAVRVAKNSPTRVVVNDRVDVALAVGAAGVHLGTQSLAPRVVRELVVQRGANPEFILGISCHSLEEAVEGESAGADYLVLGPIFETPSKIQYGPPLGLEKLREVTRRVKVPVLALGGITVERVKACLEAGAAGIAGIRIFQECDSLAERVRELRAEF